jgi:hypothetical protein
MMATEAAATEAEVRAMRDRVYGVPSSDNNWDGCRDGWMQPEAIAWLRDQTNVNEEP